MDLTALQHEFFLKNGYLCIERFIQASDCEKIMDRMKKIIAEQQNNIPMEIFSSKTNNHAQTDYFLNSGDKIHFFFEPNALDEGRLLHPIEKSLNKVGHALHELDPVFRQFSRDERIKTLCQQLGFQKPCLLQSMYIFKQPYIGAEVDCHQDGTFLHTLNHDVLGFWFALEDASTENGCLEAIPSPISTSLKKKMIRDKDSIYFETLDETAWSEELCIPLEAKQGSLIILHGRLPHKSKANLSDKSRHAFTLHAIDSMHAYPETNWLRRQNGLPDW